MTVVEHVRAVGWTRGMRAYCRQQGWRYGAQGAPREWYAAWPELARELAASAEPRGSPEG